MRKNKVLKLKIIFYYFLVLCNFCFSQSGWISQNSKTEINLSSVKFINNNTGFCIGELGKILKTTNKGNNWIDLNSGYKNNFNSLCFDNNLNVYIGGDSGLLIKTTDLGNSWNRCNLHKPSVKISSVFFVNDSLGFVGGINSDVQLPNKIFKTYDGGKNWDSILTIGSFSKTLFFINSEVGWSIIGFSTAGVQNIVKTTNGGMNWNNQLSISTINDVFFIDSVYGWSTGYGNGTTMYRSINGGFNWIFCSLCGIGISNSLFFIDNMKGWAAAPQTIYFTSNGGVNWANQTSYQPGINFRSIFFTDSLKGWAVGDSGVILKTTTGGVLTGFSTTSSEIPDRYYLSQNYPNPFNPVTNLEFGISNLGFVSLKIYDVSGKEIKTLVNEIKQLGMYKVEFDGSNLASGIYFYTIEAGSFLQTKRMLLLK